MKILIVRMYPDVLNIKSYNCQEIGLAKSLIRNGHQCDIVLYTNNDKYEEDLMFDNKCKSIHIYYLKAKKILKNAFFDKELFRIIRDYDVIQTAEYDQIANMLLMKKHKNVVLYHGPYSNSFTVKYKIKCLITDLIFKFCNFFEKYKNVKCITKSVLAEKFLINKGFKNVTTIGVGIDLERFKKNKSLNSISNFEFKKDEKVLLYVGKIERRRNVYFIVKVLKELIDKGLNYKLVIVGNGNPKYVKRFFLYVKKQGCLDNIIYYPKLEQEDLMHIYKNADIFVLPTKYEIFGMVILEAMYFGVPVITTYNGGSSTLINDENGIIVKTFEYKIWAQKIQEILNDSNKYQEMSNKAKKIINNEYSWDCLVEKFIDIYKR